MICSGHRFAENWKQVPVFSKCHKTQPYDCEKVQTGVNTAGLCRPEL